jgi:hypothetical protein
MFRDIACRNCLVNASRTVKLADFGMTRAMFESDYYRFSRKGAYYLAKQYRQIGQFRHLFRTKHFFSQNS